MHNRWHPDIPPVAEVAPREEIRLETEEGLAGQLTRDSTHADAGRMHLGLGHPLSGPVYVSGATPGDVLEIELVSYESADFGTTAVIPGFGFLADLFPEPYVVKWEIAGGLARSEELPGVAVPEEMFAGVIGVAPSHERMEMFRRREETLRAEGQRVADPFPEAAVPHEAADGLRTIPPRELGGNMDVRQLVAGSRVWLPVDVPGALFSIGDLHFAQNAAARAALLEMIDHLERTYGFERPAAYALCSVVVDLRVSEVVDVPNPVVSALLPLDVFER
jgi:formamidase